MNILDILKTNAAQYPQKLVYGYIGKEGELTEELSYDELQQQVQATSQQLLIKFPPRSRVIILLPAESGFIRSFLACLHAGIVAVPCPISYSEPGIFRILSIMRDCSASGIITNKKTYKMLFQRQNAASSALQDYDIEWSFTDDFSSQEAPGEQNRNHATVDPAYLQYTSGSTSQPKGVMISHQNLTANLSAINNCFGRTAGDVSVTWLPHYHDMGLVDGLLSPLYTGGTGYIISPLLFITKPALLLQTISKYKAGFCGGPGFGLDHCLARIPSEQMEALDLSSVRVMYVGAEPIRISSLERFAEATRVTGFRKESLVPSYGLAEATLAVSLHLNGTPMTYQTTGPNAKEVVACGPPVEFTQVLIVRPDDGAVLDEGEEGEIWVKNEAVAAGYWEKPEVSDATFRAFTSCGQGPFLRTGDLGFMDDNKLFITGRTKELIIIRGVNYYPQDIEEVVSESHQDIQPNATAAFAVETEQGESLMIVSEVRRVAQTEDDEKSIKNRMAQSVGLAFGLIPHDIVLIAPGKLPKTSSGKIQRLKAREIFAGSSIKTKSGY